MMTPMRYHPGHAGGVRRTGFGFDGIMAQPKRGQFRQWYDRDSFFPVDGNRAA